MIKPIEAPFYFSGVIDYNGECQQVSDGEAQFWTVYERNTDGLSSAICDCYHRDDAVAATERFNALIAALEQSRQQITSLFERVSGEPITNYPPDTINWLADIIEGELDASEGALVNAKKRIAELESCGRIEYTRRLERKVAELEASQSVVKLPDAIIDNVCMAASEIHNRGDGVNDDKAQFIIDRIRNYLENGGTVQGDE